MTFISIHNKNRNCTDWIIIRDTSYSPLAVRFIQLDVKVWVVEFWRYRPKKRRLSLQYNGKNTFEKTEHINVSLHHIDGVSAPCLLALSTCRSLKQVSRLAILGYTKEMQITTAWLRETLTAACRKETEPPPACLSILAHLTEQV